MINIIDKSQCCGCSACEQICNHNAIKMQPDGLGFLYPTVDESCCVDCGLCEKVCAFHDIFDVKKKPLAFAVRHKDIKEVEKSRSGAMFVAISDWILSQGGVVYGVGYTDHFRVVHKRATTALERDEFRGSKYVQSDINHTFLKIKQDLKQGIFVLFSGTPCQTSSLLSFLSLLKVKMDKLFVIDIVCHGVPSPFIWKDFILYNEYKYKSKIIKFNFRDKTKIGWAAHKESFNIGDKKYLSNMYSYLFSECIMFRHSCSICHFANTNRPSDITLGDLWGWEKIDPSLNADDKGISLVLVNSDKGRFLFDAIKDKIKKMEVDLDLCLQPNLLHPTLMNDKREDFEYDYIKYGFNYINKKYGTLGWKYKLKRFRQRSKTAFRLMVKRFLCEKK